MITFERRYQKYAWTCLHNKDSPHFHERRRVNEMYHLILLATMIGLLSYVDNFGGIVMLFQK